MVVISIAPYLTDKGEHTDWLTEPYKMNKKCIMH